MWHLNIVIFEYDLIKDLTPLTPEIDGAINRTFFSWQINRGLKCLAVPLICELPRSIYFLPWFFSLKATHINFDTLINWFLNLTTIWRIFYQIGKRFCRFFKIQKIIWWEKFLWLVNNLLWSVGSNWMFISRGTFQLLAYTSVISRDFWLGFLLIAQLR